MTAPVTIQGCVGCRVREAIDAERDHPNDCLCPDCTAAFMRDTGPWP